MRVTLRTAAKLSVYLFDEIKCVILRIKIHFEQRVSKGENALKQREMKALLEQVWTVKMTDFKLNYCILISCLWRPCL